MSLTTSSVNVLTTIARSMVVTQEYASTDFGTFSAQLRGQATPAEEDDWLAWRSANLMLADWQRAYEELQHARARA
jgi:hypothetical protein